jgi:thymidylate synthase
MHNNFKTANEAFHDLYWRIVRDGVDFAGTKALFNAGFYIENPALNTIKDSKVKRNWSVEYAEAEWQWYLSGDRNIAKLGELYGKVPAIWKRMADDEGNVNSNYGWQWYRNDQLRKVINNLSQNHESRQAAISIYDGKEIDEYTNDTPCTYAVQFTILHGRLDMSVLMRSNDLWYGFCNDQYQFSCLQMYVAYELNLPVGIYYHYAHNLHLYNDKLPEDTTRNFHK